MKVCVILLLFQGRPGEGWEPAVLNNQVEFKFLRQAQRGLSHDRSYYLGSSTVSGPGTNIDLNAYNANSNGGNLMILIMIIIFLNNLMIYIMIMTKSCDNDIPDDINIPHVICIIHFNFKT